METERMSEILEQAHKETSDIFAQYISLWMYDKSMCNALIYFLADARTAARDCVEYDCGSLVDVVRVVNQFFYDVVAQELGGR